MPCDRGTQGDGSTQLELHPRQRRQRREAPLLIFQRGGPERGKVLDSGFAQTVKGRRTNGGQRSVGLLKLRYKGVLLFQHRHSAQILNEIAKRKRRVTPRLLAQSSRTPCFPAPALIPCRRT